MHKLIFIFLFFGIFLLVCCKKSNSPFPTPTVTQNPIWTAASINIIVRNTNIQFTSVDTGFVFGYYNSFPFIAKTTDGGLNWFLLKQFDVHYPVFSSFYAIISNQLIVSRDSIYISNDGGNTFAKLPGQNKIFNAIAFYYVNGLTGFALVPNGINKTANSSMWSNVYTNNNGAGYQFIDFTDNNNGYIAGGSQVEINAQKTITSYGVLAKTSDGGNTWTSLSSGSWLNNTQNFNLIDGLSFVDSNNGYVATDDLKLMQTIDGGTTWITVNTALSGGIKYCYFLLCKWVIISQIIQFIQQQTPVHLLLMSLPALITYMQYAREKIKRCMW